MCRPGCTLSKPETIFVVFSYMRSMCIALARRERVDMSQIATRNRSTIIIIIIIIVIMTISRSVNKICAQTTTFHHHLYHHDVTTSGPCRRGEGDRKRNTKIAMVDGKERWRRRQRRRRTHAGDATCSRAPSRLQRL